MLRINDDDARISEERDPVQQFPLSTWPSCIIVYQSVSPIWWGTRRTLSLQGRNRIGRVFSISVYFPSAYIQWDLLRTKRVTYVHIDLHCWETILQRSWVNTTVFSSEMLSQQLSLKHSTRDGRAWKSYQRPHALELSRMQWFCQSCVRVAWLLSCFERFEIMQWQLTELSVYSTKNCMCKEV